MITAAITPHGRVPLQHVRIDREKWMKRLVVLIASLALVLGALGCKTPSKDPQQAAKEATQAIWESSTGRAAEPLVAQKV